MSLLVGEPPPPPTTPPPKKRRSSSRAKKRSTPRDGHKRSSPTVAANKVSLPVSEVAHAPGGVDDVPFSPLGSPGGDRDFVEGRLAAARAIYQSKTLVLDPPTGNHNVGRLSTIPTPRSGEENSSPPQKQVMAEQAAPLKSSPKSESSPASVGTEQHDNRVHQLQTKPLSINNRPASAPMTRPSALEAPTTTSSSSGGGKAKRKFRPKTPERLRRVLTPERRRSKTPELRRAKSSEKKARRAKTSDQQRHAERRRSKAPERRRPEASEIRHAETESTTSEVSRQSSKKGFFRNLFRGKKKARIPTNVDGATVVSENIVTVASGGLDTTQSLVTNVTTNQIESAQHEVVDGRENHVFETATSGEENPKSGDYFGSDQQHERDYVGSGSPDFLLHHQDEVSTLTAPTIKSNMRRRDPSEFTSDHMSDPAGRYYENVVFSGVHTQASMTSSIDPFAEDPFAVPFFEEPVVARTVETGDNSSLRVVVEDPVGDSPLMSKKSQTHAPVSSVKDPSPRLNSSPFAQHQLKDPSPRVRDPSPRIQDPSPRGYQTPSFAHDKSVQDPLGESPLHKSLKGPSPFRDGSPYAPDPPLHLQELDDSSQEEKKEDDIQAIWTQKRPPSPQTTVPSLRLTPPSPSPRSQHQMYIQDRTPLENGALQLSSPPLKGTLSSRAASPRVPRPARVSPRRTSLTKRPEMSSPPQQNDEGSVAPRSSGTMRTNEPAKNVVELLADQPSIQCEGQKQDMSDETGPSGNTLLSMSRAARSNARRGIMPSPGHIDDQNGSGKSVSSAVTAEPIDSDLVLEVSSEQLSNRELDMRDHNNYGTEKDIESSGKRLLTMSRAARTNAQAVAYLHTLNGEPSPRKYWRKPEVSDDDTSPAYHSNEARRDPFDPFFSSLQSAEPVKASEKNETEEEKVMQLFSAYSNRFKGRKPGKPNAIASSFEQSFGSRVRKNNGRTGSKGNADFFTTTPFSVGVGLRREKREQDIETGRSKRVVPQKKVKPSKEMYHYKEREPRDPIHRAGRRVLSRAAVPIQTSIRRFLAQREAVDRMWGIIEIQSCMRRWKAEISLFACCKSATLIQKVFRGRRLRLALHKRQQAAVHIQRMTRGYIASAQTFDTVYRIILVQAKARGNMAREKAKKEKEDIKRRMATSIQSWWRTRWARVLYKSLIVDIIIVQSTSRRWKAQREVKTMLGCKRFAAATKIQAHWRTFNSIRARKRSEAATRIQAMWRGFQGYTDYIFSLVDLLVVQRTSRRWLANRKVKAMRQRIAATKIQVQFRRYKSQRQLLHDLARIILVQVRNEI